MTKQIECTHWEIFNSEHVSIKTFGGLEKSKKRAKRQLQNQAFKLLETVKGSFAVLMNGENPVQEFDTPTIMAV